MNKDQTKLFDDVETVTYDFAIDSVIAIDVPIGTDPDTDAVWERLYNKLALRLREKDLTFRFENVFDSETGVYDENWEDYKRETDQMCVANKVMEEDKDALKELGADK